MEKVTHFLGRTEAGIFAQGLFGSAGAFEKTAGAPAFADWETGDELRRFIRGISAEQRKKSCYVLVNALGAGEFFGSNINADYFPWNALCHEGDDYGYKTFLRAHAFAHHVNKDPLKGFGQPVLSLLNTRMKRVELIVRLDRDKAKSEGHDGIIVRIDKGEFPDVSMGCRVPYDVCSICGNRSKTRDDYCQHMRPPAHLKDVYGPNRIIQDGRKIYVLNLTPRFFDISFVFIGADKTAKTMAKLASAGGKKVCLGPVCTTSGDEEPELYDARGERLKLAGRTKTASAPEEGIRGPCGRLCSDCPAQDRCHTTKLAGAFGVTIPGVKTASQLKVAELIKSVPAGTFAMKKLPALEAAEPDMSEALLGEMSKRDLGTSCSTAAMMGVVLKPKEFQRLALLRMGERDLLDELEGTDSVFRQVPEVVTSLDVDRERYDVGLARLLMALMKYRSVFGAPFQLRVIVDGKKSLPRQNRIEHPLLDKLSAAYNGYRQNLMMKLSQAVEVVQDDPQLREAVLGSSLAHMFSKTASASVLTPDSVRYLVGAHFQDRTLLANSDVADAVADQHPWLLNGERHALA